LIIRERIPHVIIGCIDSFSAVSGKGVEKLKKEKVSVTVGILEKECREINRRFFTFFEKRRPYIILKWAETADGFIAGADYQPLKISNDYADRLVHSWRSEEMSIMVGATTALHDDPRLTTRLWKGRNPARIVLDRKLRLPPHAHLLDGTVPTIVLNEVKNETGNNIEYIRLDYRQDIIPQVLEILYNKQLQSLMVEGGARLLQSFIDSGLWDEARVIRGSKILYGGVRAPGLKKADLQESFFLAGDEIAIYKNS
ncbi:MAG TPA: dihydrofolate reductase family protein, partial [Chitinophagaceae bacterium]